MKIDLPKEALMYKVTIHVIVVQLRYMRFKTRTTKVQLAFKFCFKF